MKLLRNFSSFAAAVFIITIIGILPANAAVKASPFPKVKFAVQPSTVYQAGDIVNFDLKSDGYGGRVQYRVVLWQDETKTYKDLWTIGDKYYTNWKPYGNDVFNLHWKIDDPGHYRITIYAKRSELPNTKTALKGMNCDSYMAGVPFVVNASGVTIGSTSNDVKNMLGQPSSTKNDGTLSVMEYPDVVLFLDRTILPNEVVGWSSNTNPKVTLGEGVSNAAPFKIGSSLQDVVRAMGTPKYIPGFYLKDETDYFVYGDDSVVFFNKDNKVTGYINRGSLKVSLGSKSSYSPSIGYNSKPADVINSLGTPDAVNAYIITDSKDADFGYRLDVDYRSPGKYYMVDMVDDYTYYEYGDSYFIFDEKGKLDSFVNQDRLPVDFGGIDLSSEGIQINSPWTEIVKANGTPEAIVYTEDFSKAWIYGNSYLGVDDNGNVLGWDNDTSLYITKEYSTPSRKPISINSAKEDVIKSMGEPDEFHSTYWKYGESVISFEGQLVKKIDNKGKNIALSTGSQVPSAVFTLGSGIEDVVKAMGAPDGVKSYSPDYIYWTFGDSKVYFDVKGSVVSWEDSGNLKLFIEPEKDSVYPPAKLGSTKEEVLKSNGIPTKLSLPSSSQDNWVYGASRVDFDSNGKVVGWDNAGGNLNFSYGEIDPSAPPFWMGATMEDVARASGDPKSVRTDNIEDAYVVWEYGNATVFFDKATGLVNGWINSGQLKVRQYLPEPSAPPIKLGFTQSDVLKLKGTPNTITYEITGGKFTRLIWEYVDDEYSWFLNSTPQ